MKNVVKLFAAMGPGDIVAARMAQSAGFAVKGTSIAYSEQLFAYCRLRRFEVLAISYNQRVDRSQDSNVTVENRPRPLNGNGYLYYVSCLLYVLYLAFRAWRFGATIAILDLGTAPSFMFFIFRIAGIPVVIDMHNSLWPCGFPPYRVTTRIVRLLNKWFFRYGTSGAIGVSPECERQFKCEASNGVPFFQYRCQFQQSGFTISPAYEGGSFKLLFVGRIEENKGVFDLLEIVKRVRSRADIPIVLEICGDGPALGALRTLVAENGLSDVIIHGRVERADLLEIYARAHAVIVPTRSTFTEGVPAVCGEAVLSGLPVITSKVANAFDVIGPATITVETNNIEGYTRALLSLTQDPQLYRTLKSECLPLSLQFLNRSFSLPAAFDRVLALINHTTTLDSYELAFVDEPAAGWLDPRNSPTHTRAIGTPSQQDQLRDENGAIVPRYVVARHCYGGIGDHLSCLVGAWWFARRNGRTIVVDWRGSRFNPDPTMQHNCFQLFFEPLPKLAGVTIISDDSVDKIRYPTPMWPSKWNQAAVASPRHIQHTNLEISAVNQIVTSTEDRAEPTVVFNQWIDPPPPRGSVEMMLNALQPIEAIRLEAQKFWNEQIGSDPAIAIHIRHGNGENLGPRSSYWLGPVALVRQLVANARNDVHRAGLFGQFSDNMPPSLVGSPNQARAERRFCRKIAAEFHDLSRDAGLKDAVPFLFCDASQVVDLMRKFLPNLIVRPKELPGKGKGPLHQFDAVAAKYDSRMGVQSGIVSERITHDMFVELDLMRRCKGLLYMDSGFSLLTRINLEESRVRRLTPSFTNRLISRIMNRLTPYIQRRAGTT